MERLGISVGIDFLILLSGERLSAASNSNAVLAI